MKSFSVIAIIILFASQNNAQSAYEFLGRIPGVPSDACSMKGEQKQQYLDQINLVLKDIEKVISSKKKSVERDVDNSKSQIEKNMAKEYGLTNADVQKLKQKKLSKEEKRAIADKMLQEKAGISMDEVKKLKKMSKEGKKAWAEGYSTEQMAIKSSNSDSSKTEEQIKAEKKMAKDKRMFDLVQEQKLILDRISASDKKYVNKLAELDKEDSTATVILDRQRKPLLKKLNDVPGPSEEEAKSIQDEIRSYEKIYCNKLTPIYMDILGECLSSLNKFMPDYKRLEEIDDELNKTTLETNKGFTSPGLYQLSAVKSYAGLLLNSFKYVNYTFPENDLQ